MVMLDHVKDLSQLATDGINFDVRYDDGFSKRDVIITAIFVRSVCIGIEFHANLELGLPSTSRSLPQRN